MLFSHITLNRRNIKLSCQCENYYFTLRFFRCCNHNDNNNSEGFSFHFCFALIHWGQSESVNQLANGVLFLLLLCNLVPVLFEIKPKERLLWKKWNDGLFPKSSCCAVFEALFFGMSFWFYDLLCILVLIAFAKAEIHTDIQSEPKEWKRVRNAGLSEMKTMN